MEDIKSMSAIKKIIPIGIKKVIKKYTRRILGLKESKESYEDVKKQMILMREKVEEAIPKNELTEKHIANLRIVIDREALLKLMPTHGVCAEIGVNRGEFSLDILNITEP